MSLGVDRKIHEYITKITERLNKTEINSIGEKGKILKKWKIENSTYSCIENKYDYYFKLTEIEDFHIDSLTIGRVNFYPYSYKEEFVNDGLMIEAKVKLSEFGFAELKELIEKNDYFKVIRHGISEKPREMIFGLPSWSKHEETIKYNIILSEKKCFETQKIFSDEFFQRIDNMSFSLEKQDKILKELLAILTSKNLLTNEEIAKIKEKASKQTLDRQIDFYCVKDIDEFL